MTDNLDKFAAVADKTLAEVRAGITQGGLKMKKDKRKGNEKERGKDESEKRENED